MASNKPLDSYSCNMIMRDQPTHSGLQFSSKGSNARASKELWPARAAKSSHKSQNQFPELKKLAVRDVNSKSAACTKLRDLKFINESQKESEKQAHSSTDKRFPDTMMMRFRATSHTRLRARDHYTSSTLIGGKGGAGPSSLPTTLEGPTEYVNARWM
jgi:hypothetical protein